MRLIHSFYLAYKSPFKKASFLIRNTPYIISPLLKEVWLQYKDQLQLWSHQPLNFDEVLSGVPDYIVARRSARGKIILDQPYFILIKAKKDNFDEGWGQCLAELVAAQKLNQAQDYSPTVFGIVSNGKLWEFGQLEKDTFTKNSQFYTLRDLNPLMSAINYLFAESAKLVPVPRIVQNNDNLWDS